CTWRTARRTTPWPVMDPARLLAASAVVGLLALSAGAANLLPEDAARHIGETATVCGVVASDMFEARRSRHFGSREPDPTSRLHAFAKPTIKRTAKVGDHRASKQKLSPRPVSPRAPQTPIGTTGRVSDLCAGEYSSRLPMV